MDVMVQGQIRGVDQLSDEQLTKGVRDLITELRSRTIGDKMILCKECGWNGRIRDLEGGNESNYFHRTCCPQCKIQLIVRNSAITFTRFNGGRHERYRKFYRMYNHQY